MSGVFQLTIGEKEITVLCGETDDLVYLHSEKDEAEAIFALLSAPRPTLVAISKTDWNAELSPWRADKVFHSGETFSGGAPIYLDFITNKLIPYAENALRVTARKRYIAGYSLAGLFAVWAQFQTNAFDGFASVSGSLWYDGFLDFISKSKTIGQTEKGYFSLGSREKITKNPRIATVEEATRRAEKYFSALGAKTIFELNEGGHFQNMEKRTAAGIIWLVKD